MSIKKLLKNSEGDTIVEVLISIAIISLVLTISYSLSNRSSQYIQQSQERGEAQKISEQQLELLRNYLQPTTDWEGSHYKCFDDGTPASGIPPKPTTLATKCNKGTKDNGQGRYKTAIVYDTTTNTYTVTTTWSSLTSAPQQTLALSYKLPAASLATIGTDPVCADDVDNDGDSKVDIDDPGCHPSDGDASNDDSYDAGYGSEADPPPNCAANRYLDISTNTCIHCPALFSAPAGPPDALTCSISITGSAQAYLNCVGDCFKTDPDFTNEVFWLSGGADTTVPGNGVTPPGNPANVTYSLIPTSGTYNITLNYFNAPAGGTCFPPPPGYSYHIKIDYPGGSTTADMPSYSTDNCKTLHTYTFSDLQFANQPTSTLKITWDNDYWRPGVNDVNFGLQSIVYEGTSP